MSRRRGRSVRFRATVFPSGTASGLWLDTADRDLVVTEERTAPGRRSVVVGHELWRPRAGPKVAARTLFDLAEAKEAGAFGPLPAGKCRIRPPGSSLREPLRQDRPAGSAGGIGPRDGSRRHRGVRGRVAERTRPGA